MAKPKFQEISWWLELSKVSSLIFFPSPLPTLLQLKCFSFHVLLYVDVISTIMQEIQLAWSAMLNPVKNNKQMWMKGIYGGDETDFKKNHQALFLTRSWLWFLVVIFFYYGCIMYPVLFLILFINVEPITSLLKISLNHCGMFVWW